MFPERTAAFPIGLLIIGVLVTIWSYIDPHDRFTWWLEALPALIAAVLLWATYRRFRFTDLAYGLIFVHAVILLIGAHYTYAEVPPFNWLRDTYDLSRNHYDRIGHFAQGFVPAMVARELLLRTSPLERGRWLFALVVLSCLGISAAYELLEWAAAEVSGEAAASFLGTQGDNWDTQKDMALALVGATTALLVLGRLHDRLLARLD
jgi:putative membrane protein